MKRIDNEYIVATGLVPHLADLWGEAGYNADGTIKQVGNMIWSGTLPLGVVIDSNMNTPLPVPGVAI